MTEINQARLATLYKAEDINEIWNSSQACDVIDHPQEGKISPNRYRAISQNKPCPYCAKKMVHGHQHKTSSKQEAIERGYEYINSQGKTKINRIGNTFFHPNYVTLDHKINKARCPEKLFDYDNLEVICWRCNKSKRDNNAFELKHNRNYFNALAEEALSRYPIL